MRRFGYRIQRFRPQPPFGIDPFRDMRKLLPVDRSPIIFDVGANVGQTIENFRRSFGQPTIHSFEPSSDAFVELQNTAGLLPGVVLNNFALGARSGEAQLFESAAGTPINSLLEPGPEGYGEGKVKGTVPVHVSTVDQYCRDRGIERIDILKTDAQGYDFEVIKGATEMIAARAVHLIYMEIIFSDWYRGQPRMDEVYGFIADHGFVLVTFYPFYYWDNKASWTEALFRHPEYRFKVDA